MKLNKKQTMTYSHSRQPFCSGEQTPISEIKLMKLSWGEQACYAMHAWIEKELMKGWTINKK